MKKKRIIKDPVVRKLEIMAVAKQLFETRGYEQTAVDEIIRTADIAKGTFYYYFKTKKDILNALVDSMVEELVDYFRQLLGDSNLSALEKLQRMTRSAEKQEIINPELMESVHLVENREMQEALNVRLVDTIAPLFAEIFSQGYQEKIFKKKTKLEEVQLILIGSQFILDSGLFTLSPEKRKRYLEATRNCFAMLNGVKPELFDFIVNETEENK